jgi:hypothetical protein
LRGCRFTLSFVSLRSFQSLSFRHAPSFTKMDAGHQR